MPRGRPRKDGGVATLENQNRILSVDEKEGIEHQIEIEKKMLGATDDFSESQVTQIVPPELSINKSAITKKIGMLQNVIAAGSASKATGERRLKLENERKALEDLFEREQVLETVRDLGAIHIDSLEYREAYRKGEMRQKYESRIQRWIQICKELEPEDKEFCKLDRLRKAK